MPPIGFCLLAALVSFIIQTWPRFKNRWFGIDTWRHLAAADHIRRTGKAFSSMPEYYLIEEPSDYPPLLRVLLAIFPKGWVERWQGHLSSVIDFCHSVLIFSFAYALTGQWQIGVAGQFCYAFSPLVIMENASLTTRTISSLLFSMAILPLVIFMGTGDLAWWGIAVGCLGLLFLAHRLAIQALVVLIPVLCVTGKSLWPLAAFFGGMALAVLLSRGQYLKILSGHIAMLVCWRRNIKDRFAHQVRGVLSLKQKDPDPVFQIYAYLRQLPALAVLGAHPVLPLILLSVAGLKWAGRWQSQGVPDGLVQLLWIWSLTLWIAALAVRQIPAIRFLGEGERYVEYANPPAAILGGVVLIGTWQQPDLRWITLAFGAAMMVLGWLPALFLQKTVVLNDTERSVTPALRSIFDALNAAPGEVRLLTMPTYLADATLYFTKARVVSTDNSHAHNTHYDGLWPRLTRPFSEFVERYKITHVLINDKYVSLKELGLSESRITQRAGNYCLLKI